MVLIQMYNVLLLDDHKAITTGIRYAIEKSGYFHVENIITSPNELLMYLPGRKIDLIITDIKMPGDDIFKIIFKIKKTFSTIKIVFYTMCNGEGFFRDARNLAVDGYILKSDDLDLLPDILLNTMDGIFYCSGELRKFLGSDNLFNDKEHLILKYLLDGYRPSEIAQHLSKSKRMVEYHLCNIRDKLGLKSNMELIARYKEVYYK